MLFCLGRRRHRIFGLRTVCCTIIVDLRLMSSSNSSSSSSAWADLGSFDCEGSGHPSALHRVDKGPPPFLREVGTFFEEVCRRVFFAVSAEGIPPRQNRFNYACAFRCAASRLDEFLSRWRNDLPKAVSRGE